METIFFHRKLDSKLKKDWPVELHMLPENQISVLANFGVMQAERILK